MLPFTCRGVCPTKQTVYSEGIALIRPDSIHLDSIGGGLIHEVVLATYALRQCQPISWTRHAEQIVSIRVESGQSQGEFHDFSAQFFGVTRDVCANLQATLYISDKACPIMICQHPPRLPQTNKTTSRRVTSFS